MNIPPRKGCDRPYKALTDEKAALAPHSHAPQEEPVQPEFQVSPMPQPNFFPPITPKAFQPYMNF